MSRREELVLDLVETVSRFGRNRLQRQRKRGLRPAEYSVLGCILNHLPEGGIGLQPSQISTLLHVKQPTITPIINRMELQGLLKRTRTDEDRRSVYISVTEKGHEYLHRTQEIFMKDFSSLVDALGEEKSEQFCALLKEIIQYYEEQSYNRP